MVWPNGQVYVADTLNTVSISADANPINVGQYGVILDAGSSV